MQELRLPVKPATIVDTMSRSATCLVVIAFMWSSLASARPHQRQARKGRAVPTYTRSGDPNIQAQAAVVMDLTEGQELFMKNPDAIRPIASISKLMAMLAVLDRNLPLDAATTMIESDRKIASGGARSRLPMGMEFTNRDLLHAALMASDNRAVPALGRAVGLDPEQLVTAMNDKAKQLGMLHTHFEDPVGLNPGNTSTPRDLVLMLRAAIKQPLISEITQKAKYVAHPVGRPGWTIEYSNTDLIARNGKWSVLTGKTGYTDLALYCLAIAVRMAAQHDVAMVFLGAVGKMTRFADFQRVAQWLSERKWKSVPAASAKM
jgi:D-alanyl-D-alanine endopeptidase (penicillin-binding protein 7)